MTMAKRLVAKVGTYTDRDGNEKGRYVEVGVILSNDNGEFALLDPSVNLAGVMLQQRVAGMGKRDSDRVMVSIFDNDSRGSGQTQQRRGGGGQDTAPPKGSDFDDDIPF
jgi:hypothetical protein